MAVHGAIRYKLHKLKKIKEIKENLPNSSCCADFRDGWKKLAICSSFRKFNFPRVEF
jgi:hypothetical protein